jgi:hypothetical protein
MGIRTCPAGVGALAHEIVRHRHERRKRRRYLCEELGLTHIDQVQPRYLQGSLVTPDRCGRRGSSHRCKVATIPFLAEGRSWFCCAG